MTRKTEQLARPPPLPMMSAWTIARDPSRAAPPSCSACGIRAASARPGTARTDRWQAAPDCRRRRPLRPPRKRHAAVILRAIADGEAGLQEQPLQADAALAEHGGGARRHFL